MRCETGFEPATTHFPVQPAPGKIPTYHCWSYCGCRPYYLGRSSIPPLTPQLSNINWLQISRSTSWSTAASGRLTGKARQYRPRPERRLMPIISQKIFICVCFCSQLSTLCTQNSILCIDLLFFCPYIIDGWFDLINVFWNLSPCEGGESSGFWIVGSIFPVSPPRSLFKKSFKVLLPIHFEFPKFF